MLEALADKIVKYVPSHRIDCFGPNSLLFSTIPYYVLLFIMVVGINIYDVTHNPYVLLFIIYGLIPMVDELITMDNRNPTNEQAKAMADKLRFQVPLYVTIVVDWIIFFYAMNQYSETEINTKTFFQLLGFVVVVSNLNAAQFSVSHEVMHKPGWRRIVGTLHMLKTLNMHFTYQHLFGHHRKVATP